MCKFLIDQNTQLFNSLQNFKHAIIKKKVRRGGGGGGGCTKKGDAFNVRRVF